MTGNLSDAKPDSFMKDAAVCWRMLPNKAFFFALLAAWLALFHFLGNSILGYVHSPSLFAWLDNAYNTSSESDDGYGSLIPFVVVGLFWWKRKQLLALRLEPWWPAIFIVAAGALLHYCGYILQQPRFSTMALVIGIYGLTGLAWGRAWLVESIFPFWLFVFSVPLAAWLLPLTFPLRLAVTWLTWAAAQIMLIDVNRVGTALIDPNGQFQYDVAAACSGMKSLVSIFLLSTIYGCILFRSLKRRLVFVALALPLAVLGNFLRLLCIVVAGKIGGQSAGNFVHENAVTSLLPYIPAFAGVYLLGNWMEKKLGKEAA